LERGSFAWPRAAADGQTKLALKPEAFAMLTDGIDMHRANPRGWYERDCTSPEHAFLQQTAQRVIDSGQSLDLLEISAAL